MILKSFLDLRADSGGTSSLASPSSFVLDAFGLVPSEAGVLVSERNAMGLSAVWTCVNIRAGLLASLPFNLYSVDANGRRKLALSRREHSILHDRTSPEDTSYQFRHKMAANWLLWGNAYAFIETDGRGQLKFLWPYHPNNVRVVYGAARGEYHYVVTGWSQGGPVQMKVMPEDMLHLRGLSYEGVQGLSVIQNYRRGLGLAMAREIFESNFVKNGAKTSGVLTYPGRLSPEGRENLNSSFQEKYAGSQNAGRTILLEEGAKYQALTMPLSDAEFTLSKRLSRAEIAGIFGVPTMLVPGADDKAATYASSEIFNRQLVDYTLRNDCTNFEHEFNSKLFPQGDHLSIFDLHDLLRGDSVARAQYFYQRWQTGSISANEMRAEEGENPISAPSGNKYYIQSGYVDANAPAPPPPKPAPSGDPANPNPNPGHSEPDPAQSPANRPPKPGKSAQVGSGFRTLMANLASEIQGWESFSPKRAAAKLRGLLVEPLSAELGEDNDEEWLQSCADALALRIRELKRDKIGEELDHAMYLLREKRS